MLAQAERNEWSPEEPAEYGWEVGIIAWLESIPFEVREAAF